MSRVNEKVERGSTFYVHVQPSIFCLYFIYVRKIYVRTHVKITRQWKSTFIVRWVKCYWLIDENILGQVFGIPADFAGANDITNLPGKTRDAGMGIVIGRSHSVILFSHITSCISLSTPFPCFTVWFMIWFLFVSYLTVFLHFFFALLQQPNKTRKTVRTLVALHRGTSHELLIEDLELSFEPRYPYWFR